jgi:heat-inducible transcriptional repressor
VDRLSSIKPMSAAEKSAIRTFLAGAVDLDDVVDRTVRLLSTLTRQVAVMQYPSLTRSTVRHIELVPLGSDRLMVVVIVNTGRVEQRIVTTDGDLVSERGETFVARLRSELNAEVSSRPFLEASARLSALADRFEPADRDTVRSVARALDEALLEEREERVVLAGTSNLARFGPDFPLTIGPVLEALEEHVVLLKLLGTLGSEAGTGLGHDAVAVRIGHENAHQGLTSTSVVSTGYAAGSEVVAGLGVLGPTRMDYPTAMTTVRAVARYVSEILGP